MDFHTSEPLLTGFPRTPMLLTHSQMTNLDLFLETSVYSLFSLGRLFYHFCPSQDGWDCLSDLLPQSPEHLIHNMVAVLLILVWCHFTKNRTTFYSSLHLYPRISVFILVWWMNECIQVREGWTKVHPFPIWSLFITNKPQKARKLERCEELWVYALFCLE